MTPLVLLILDGWGIGPRDKSNPIFAAEPQYMNYIRTHYVSGALQASGIAVGLPWGEEGNSEVGHLTIGTGRRVYQYYPRISLDIKDGKFFENDAFLKAFSHAEQHGSAVHLIGLLTESNIHASLDHIHSLLRLAKQKGSQKAFLHLFADGKDSRPRSVEKLLGIVEGFIKEVGIGQIASLSGRYYALDRTEHWDRTEIAYKALTGSGPITDSLSDWISAQYEEGLEDQFIGPVLLGPESHPIRDNDALIFFNFREDSIKQLASAFLKNEFDGFVREPLNNLFVTTMTEYFHESGAAVAYPPQDIPLPLGEVLSQSGKAQIRIAETDKHAHVTFFFNGYRDEPFANEYRVLVPSKKGPHVEAHPEMMAEEVGTRVIEAIEGGGFDLVVANLPNADIVAHTGNFDATVQGVKAVDRQVGRIQEAVLKHDATLIITADHGHAERMRDPLTGSVENRHAQALVPFYLVGKGYEREKTEQDAYLIEQSASGILSDVAPTILELMGLPQSKQMTGQSLLKIVR